MADNVTLNAGSGGATLATDDIGGTHYQIIKLAYGALDSATLVDTSNRLPTSAAQNGTWNITNISGTVSLPTGAATAAKQPALGTAGSASADVITVQGITSMTALKVDGSGVTQPVSGTVGISGTVTVDSELTTADLDTGAGTDTRAVVGLVLAASGGGLLVGSANPMPIGDNSSSLTVDAPVGTPVFVRLSDGSAAITNLAVNLAQVAGTTTATGNGTASAGCQRVTIASDNTAFSVNASQSGTWTVQPGNTANTTPWLTTSSPATSGGLSVATGSIAATKTDIKTNAGQVYGWYFYNANASVAYVQFFNATAANVTLGTTAPVYSLGIPAGSAANVELSNGVAHGTAISIAVTTTRAGSTGPGSTVDYNVFYK